MENITIQEEFTLPSLGKIYERQFDPTVKLRSMTVAEEMKRLTATDTPYKSMAEIIDACTVNKLPISSYDMCLGDYQFLLHRLRVVTYGNDYKIQVRCPHCGRIFNDTLNLDELKINTYEDDVKDIKTFTLPATGDTIEIGFQTPRDLDYIQKRKLEIKKQFPDSTDDPTLVLNLLTMIKTVNGKVQTPAILEAQLKKLPLKDYQVIIKNATELNRKVGVDIGISLVCPECKNNVNTNFRFTDEFFGPTLD